MHAGCIWDEHAVLGEAVKERLCVGILSILLLQIPLLITCRFSLISANFNDKRKEERD